MAAFRQLLFAVVLFLAPQIRAQTLGPIQQGVATFYGGPQDNLSPDVASFGVLKGSCGYGALQRTEWPYWQATAISRANSVYSAGNLLGCGLCIQATCTSGCIAGASPLTVLVTDTCDSCATNQLNIHASAFATHFQSDLSIGQVLIQWQQVPCNPPGNIVVKVVDSRTTDGGFMAIALLDVGGSGVIKLIEFMNPGSSAWVPMTNQYGSVWQVSQFGSPPFSLRITGGSGEVLIAIGVITAVANAEYTTSVQFGGSKSSGGPPPSQALAGSPPAIPSSITPPRGTAANAPTLPTNVPVVATNQTTPAATPATSPRLTPVRRTPSTPSTNATAPAANATAPAANATAPAANATPSPSATGPESNATSPASSVPSSPEIAPSAFAVSGPSPTAGPNETTLTVNSNLTGTIAVAANTVVNPTINIAG